MDINTLTYTDNITLNTKTYTTQSKCEPLVCSVLPIT